jgi:hypothetical protein
VGENVRWNFGRSHNSQTFDGKSAGMQRNLDGTRTRPVVGREAFRRGCRENARRLRGRDSGCNGIQISLRDGPLPVRRRKDVVAR